MVRKAKEEEGATHWFKCSMGDSCGAWVEVWIPKVVSKDFLKLPLYCGFCAAEKLDSQEKAIEQLQNQLQASTTTVEAPKSNAPSYSTILQGVRKEEAESKRKAKNVLVWGVKKADEPKDKEFMLQLSADLGTDIDVTGTKRKWRTVDTCLFEIRAASSKHPETGKKTQGARTLHKYLHQ